MRIAMIGASPTLNTAYGIQNNMWAEEMGKTHEVLVFPDQKVVGKTIQMGAYKLFPSDNARYRELVDSGKIDILYTHTDVQVLQRISRTPNDFTWIARVPIDTDRWSQSWHYLLEKPDILVTETEATQRMLKNHGFDSIQIPPAISDAYTMHVKGKNPPAPWKGKDDFLMLFVARPHWRKNLPTLLVALDRMVHQEKMKNVKLFIHSDMKDFEATKMDYALLIQALELQDHVLMPSNFSFDSGVEEKILEGLYDTADCLITPNLGEGFGVTQVEAMACGCPVIGTGYTSGPELIGKDRGQVLKTERLVDIDGIERPVISVNSIIDSVKNYIDHPDLKAAHGKAGAEYAAAHFAKSVVFPKWHALINDLKINSVILNEDKLHGVV
jgi:glycosyltransferase involved in cell wall biosynthesis